jgi:hypothetical protein
VSHARPQPPQLVMVFVAVSQPFAFVPDVSQSPKPTAQPLYVHFPATHAAPRLVAVSHFTPHAPQFEIVLSADSQPSVSGGDVMQSPYPGEQLV